MFYLNDTVLVTIAGKTFEGRYIGSAMGSEGIEIHLVLDQSGREYQVYGHQVRSK